MTTPNIEELMALADRYATLRIGEGTANARKELHDAMQSQAERIKELEAEIITRTTYGDEQTDFAIKLAAERDALRAQLSEIAATEPVARTVADTTNTGHSYVKVLVNELPFRTELFTRPMPAQPIIGLQAIHDAITVDPTLAEIEKAEPVASHYFDIEGNLYTAHRAKLLKPSLNGLTPLFTRPMPPIIGLQDVHDAVTADPTLADCAQDVTELVEALECAKNSLVAFKLMPVPSNAWEDHDEANLEVVNAALSKYKGAKRPKLQAGTTDSAKTTTKALADGLLTG